MASSSAPSTSLTADSSEARAAARKMPERNRA
jgi:hypothetical protein